ncbi:transglycosylase SLT domain-containing protein [Bradyrhizobium sp. Tv2a-2]|uniref:transglycosylase SLT domain-containing protein n=1 Tax=Bradyrhizobium sp. Tv2a-2 TaxID=113395 RepID=UPI00041CF98F|nr:transglycosylase SLT domain-containing protein [Bradyrhizobium sp. Tv2a-2]
MNQLFRPLPCLFVLAVLASPSSDAIAASRHKPVSHEKKAEAARDARHEHSSSPKQEAGLKKGKKERIADKRRKKDKSDEEDAPRFTGDLGVLKDVIDLSRQGKTSDATVAEKTIADPAARKLAEWFILRHPDSQAPFGRYASFIVDNSDWPGVTLMRRRAEARLWQEKADAATVHNFTSDRPFTAKGKFALARVRLNEGDRDGAQRLISEAWRSEELTERSEGEVLDAFGNLLTREDFQARMDKRIGAKDFGAAMRAAHHVDDNAVAIVKACSTVKGNDDKAGDRLEDVASGARDDLGYVLCRVQWLMKKDKIVEASRLVLAAPQATMPLQDTDEWWRVRRLLARKLLDQGDVQGAYELARTAATPASDNYRADQHFMSGWIALRYLNDPRTAMAHFIHIDEGCANPITLARANYWRGRAAEAVGDLLTMRANYEAAARQSTAYYGQLARARLGMNRMEVREPQGDEAQRAQPSDEIVRAADMLYTLGEREVLVSFVIDLAEDSNDVATLSAVADVTGRHNDARAMLELGKTALGRGLPVDAYAFPTIGIPAHTPVGPAIDRSIIYSVARTESAFNQKDKSSANAVGLMQVTPEAGRDTAKRFGVEYDWDRMVSDPVYNTQMGAAELSALLSEYKGSQIMTFAGYNAGRGRVRDWIKAYGDPRDPNVDPVDWVERIPFSETRNYVQRVMENLAVYRARFGNGGPLIANTDQRAISQEATASGQTP